MQKRHFETAAKPAEAYTLLFEAFNPRFNRQRFLKACGLL